MDKYDDGGWTTVRYGRRRNGPSRGRSRGPQDWTYQGMDRAFPVSGWRRGTRFPKSSWGRAPVASTPNWPVPPVGRPVRGLGPQSRSYAAVVRGVPTGPASTFRAPNPRGQQEYYQAADPKFGQLVRKLHTVIKLVHHLQNVTMKPGKADPQMIARTVDALAALIKPARPTPATMDLIVGNAKNWGHNTLIILRDHYTDALEELLQELPRDLGPNWKEAFTVAVRWARRNLPRISDDVIDHAEAMVTACGLDSGVQQAPHIVAQIGEIENCQQSQPARGAQEGTRMIADIQVECQVQISRTQSVATMTEIRPDWSISGDSDDSDDEGPQIQQMVVPVAPASPKQQRRERREQNPCVIQEHAPSLQIQEMSSPSPVRPSTSKQRCRVVCWDSLLDEEVPGSEQDNTPVLDPVADRDPGSEQDDTPSLAPVSESSALSGTPQGPQRWTPSYGSSLDWSAGSQLDALSQLTSTPEQQIFRVGRNVNTERKMIDWDLEVHKKWLFIGDSNLARIPDFSIPDLQIESYPGANFRHAQALLEKARPSDLVVEKVVLSFGINSRGQLAKETAVKQLQGALRAAKRRFPYSEMWIPLVNFSTNLPLREQATLEMLNQHITKNMPYIPLLGTSRFNTEDDHIHWTRDTAKAMFDHWVAFLNFPAL